MKNQIVVGVIGCNGNYGRWLTMFFGRQGYKVIGSDIGTQVTNRQVVEWADVVIFSVPIDQVVSVVESVVEYSRENQLFMDVTSIKGPAVEAMLKSKASVVGLHPMCAPPSSGGTLRGQVVIRCDARSASIWTPWVDEFLAATEATIKKSTSKEHDEKMAFIQALPHAVHLSMARVIREFNVDVNESMSYTSPFYKIAFGLMGRILSKEPGMYASIQMDNPLVPQILRAFEEETLHLREVIEEKDKSVFETEFKKTREHFGEEALSTADKFFDDIIGLMADFSKENMLVLETEADHPGLLHKIAVIFADAGVNLTSLHSQKMKDGKPRFLVAFDQRKDSPAMKAVENSLKEISCVKIVS